MMPDMTASGDDNTAAYRAAGQAMAALMHGVSISTVNLDGIAYINEYDEPQPQSEILSDIAIGLTGVAAEPK